MYLLAAKYFFKLDVFLPDLITKHDCIKLGVAAVVVE
jgi:hypothetical protein